MWNLSDIMELGYYFEPDEWAHTEIAKEFINKFDKKLIPDGQFNKEWTTWQFGIQTALVSYPILKTANIKPLVFITFTARTLSIIYSLALTLLVYLITLFLFKNKQQALLAAALKSIFDLTSTYSHYGTPDIAHVFWFYTSIFLILTLLYPQLYDYLKTDSPRINQGLEFIKSKNLLLAAFSTAMTAAVRFDVVPIILFTTILAKKLFRSYTLSLPAQDQESRQALVKLMIYFIMLTVALFYAIHFFSYTPADFLKAVQKLTDGNNFANVWYNIDPIKILKYLFIIIAGTSLPIFVAFILSAKKVPKTQEAQVKLVLSWLAIALLLAYIFIHFGTAVTVRRANIFLPFIAIVTAGGIIRFKNSQFPTRLKVLAVYATLIYTALLTIWNQHYFLQDPRYETASFLKNNRDWEDKTFVYTDYAPAVGMPSGFTWNFESIFLKEKYTALMRREDEPKLIKQFVDFSPEILVMHETSYGRYWKSVSNPAKTIFAPPQCCSEVFRCKDVNFCQDIQGILAGQREFQFIKKFEIRDLFPERLLYKKLFGTYETFLGDVLIYQKKKI